MVGLDRTTLWAALPAHRRSFPPIYPPVSIPDSFLSNPISCFLAAHWPPLPTRSPTTEYRSGDWTAGVGHRTERVVRVVVRPRPRGWNVRIIGGLGIRQQPGKSWALKWRAKKS